MRRRLGAIAFVIFAFAAASACTLPFTGRYDAEIESEINKYQKDVTKFIKDAEQGGPGRVYASQPARDFYSTAAADLSNVILRAEATSAVSKCPTTEASKLALDVIGNTLKSSASRFKNNPVIAKTVTDVTSVFDAPELQSGSCTVVVMKALKANQDLLEAIHKREGTLIPPVTTLALANIQDTVRVALATAVAYKP